MPKVAPIIVAAVPIPDDLNANQLLDYGEQILYGLLDKQVQVVSYACDRMEVEHSVQQLFIKIMDRVIHHVIKNPWKGCPDTEVVIEVFCDQPIVMVQDSKHRLKTFCHNIFSGACLLTLANYTAIYCRIQELAYEAGTLLYH
jgi:hypothetical protein